MKYRDFFKSFPCLFLSPDSQTKYIKGFCSFRPEKGLISPQKKQSGKAKNFAELTVQTIRSVKV